MPVKCQQSNKQIHTHKKWRAYEYASFLLILLSQSSTHQLNDINTSTPQHINTSTSTSTHQHINTSTHRHINTSTHLNKKKKRSSNFWRGKKNDNIELLFFSPYRTGPYLLGKKKIEVPYFYFFFSLPCGTSIFFPKTKTSIFFPLRLRNFYFFS